MQSQLPATTFEYFFYASILLQLSTIVIVALIEFCFGLVRGIVATCNKLLFFDKNNVFVKVELMGVMN
jgi:hypothetical protein